MKKSDIRKALRYASRERFNETTHWHWDHSYKVWSHGGYWYACIEEMEEGYICLAKWEAVETGRGAIEDLFPVGEEYDRATEIHG